MTKALFKRNLRTNWPLILFFSLLLILYFSVIFNMYDPEQPDLFSQFASFKIPQAFMAAFGFDVVTTNLVGFLGAFFYGMLMVAVPMVVLMVLANKLVSQMVERGTLASVLAAPLTRREIALTQALFLMLCALFLVALITGLGLFLSSVFQPGRLNIPAFLKMNLGVLALHLFISGLSFFFSCLFSDTCWSLSFGSGLPVLFLLLQMLSKTGSRAKVLQYLTPFTLFDPLPYARDLSAWPQTMILFLMGLLLYAAGIGVFMRKDLPV